MKSTSGQETVQAWRRSFSSEDLSGNIEEEQIYRISRRVSEYLGSQRCTRSSVGAKGCIIHIRYSMLFVGVAFTAKREAIVAPIGN